MAADMEGRKIAITTTNQVEYSGIVNKVDEVKGMITLRNVSTEGAKLCGLQQFCVSKIEKMDIGHRSSQADSQKEQSATGKRNGVNFVKKHKKIDQPHLYKLRNLDTDKLATCQSIFAENEEDESLGAAEDNFDDFYVTDECTVIARVCEKFHEAIEYLMKQQEVAVTFEGVDICRDGTLSLIQVATGEEVIIFDMLRLGEQAFVEGLHIFFESDDVCKIIHDCRWISDILYHVYGVSLANVFDTQVACAYVYSLCHNADWPRHVESLDGALRNHLGLSQEEVFSMRVRERSKTQDQQMWLHRPVPDKLLSLTCKNIRYLMPLQRVLRHKMMLVFNVGIGLYLDQVRNASQGSIEKYRTMSHLLPMAFSDMNKYVQYEITNSMDHRMWQDKKYCSYDTNGFRFNVLTDNKGADVVRSHDSIWHRSEEYYAPFRKRHIDPKSAAAANGLPPEERDRQRYANLGQSNANQVHRQVKGMERTTAQRVAKSPVSHSPSPVKESGAKQTPRQQPASKMEDSKPLPRLIPSDAQSVLGNDIPSSSRATSLSKPSSTDTSSPTHQASPSSDEINSSSSSSKVSKSKLFQLLHSPPDNSNLTKSKTTQVETTPQPSGPARSQTSQSRAGESKNSGVCGSEEPAKLDERQRCERALSQLENLKFIPMVKKKLGEGSTRKSPHKTVQGGGPEDTTQNTEVTKSNLDSHLKHIRQKILYSDGSSKSSTQSSGEEPGEILTFQPAGARQSLLKRTKEKSWQQGRPHGHSRKDLSEMSMSSAPALISAVSDNEEEEMGAIPMHQTLHRKPRSLGGPSAIGDLFQAEGGPDTHPADTEDMLLPSKFTLDQLETDSISDAELEMLEQTDVYKKTLEQTLKLVAASNTGLSSLKTRLMPSKLKVASKPRASY